MTVAYPETDLYLEPGDSDKREKKDSPSISRFCAQKLGRIRFKLICFGGSYLLGTLVIYPLFYKELSLFPNSQALSFFQALVIIAAIPAAACYSFYKNRIQDHLKKIHNWNEMDAKRCSAFAQFLSTIHEQDNRLVPCTDPIIHGKRGEGDWTIHAVEFGPVQQDLALLLKGMTLSHSRNYAGLGFGIITGREPDQDLVLQEAHNIKGVLTLRNNQMEKKVFLPGPQANIQWLSQMQHALMGAPFAPDGSHTHGFVTSLSFTELLEADHGFDNLKKMILAQVEAKEDEKLPVHIRGFNIMDQYTIATQMNIGQHPPVPLYQTGFFNLFTEKIHSLKLIPQIYLPN